MSSSDAFTGSRVAETLRRALFAGDIPAGELLPGEAALAEAHACDVVEVRAALRELRVLNLVTILPDGSARARDWRVTGELALLPYVFDEAPSAEWKTSLAEEVLLVRRVVLADAAARAAERATPADLARLHAIAAEMHACRGDSATLLQLDLRFLEALVDATHSTPIRWTANSFFRVYEAFIRSFPNVWAIPRDHFAFLTELIRGLGEREVESVRALVRTHFERTDTLVVALVRHYMRSKK